ncbi:hypothetical protein GW17_00023816 [Ensete ventricosum]|nr:hypothetical protein GW17_00023816 [Ensete ventricosum]RZR86498.1 hypothetical protein BHM03_00013700 [Ensete ventricosum]
MTNPAVYPATGFLLFLKRNTASPKKQSIPKKTATPMATTDAVFSPPPPCPESEPGSAPLLEPGLAGVAPLPGGAMEEGNGGERPGRLGVVPPEELLGGDAVGGDACLGGGLEGGLGDADGGEGREGALLGGLADGAGGEEPDGGDGDAGGVGEPEDGGGDGTEGGGGEAVEFGGGDNSGGGGDDDGTGGEGLVTGGGELAMGGGGEKVEGGEKLGVRLPVSDQWPPRTWRCADRRFVEPCAPVSTSKDSMFNPAVLHKALTLHKVAMYSTFRLIPGFPSNAKWRLLLWYAMHLPLVEDDMDYATVKTSTSMFVRSITKMNTTTMGFYPFVVWAINYSQAH